METKYASPDYVIGYFSGYDYALEQLRNRVVNQEIIIVNDDRRYMDGRCDRQHEILNLVEKLQSGKNKALQESLGEF